MKYNILVYIAIMRLVNLNFKLIIFIGTMRTEHMLTNREIRQMCSK